MTDTDSIGAHKPLLPPIGDPRWQVLRDYVTFMQAMFHLATWQVTILEGELPDSDTVVIEQALEIDGERTDWRVGPKFFAGTPEEQRAAVVHELIHMHLWHSWHDMANALEEAVPAGLWPLIAYPHEHANERATDRLAWVVAGHYDLIEWPEATTTGE